MVPKTDWHQPWHQRPHVVLLGAGASRQAFPRGDKNGRVVPLMNDLIEVCGLQEMLDAANVECGPDAGGFEAIYSRLLADKAKASLREDVENKVFEYFAALEFPAEPTLYDHLVLSLREKDMIATFNWDPFLVHALARNATRATPPQLAFLHGNVAVGFCDKHDRFVQGTAGSFCHQCGRRLRGSPILFPIEQKGYNETAFLKDSWQRLKVFLKHAYIWTIFGYSAPVSDVEAVQLLKEGWGDTSKRYFEEIEIIDTKEHAAIYSMWDPFICQAHFQVYRTFDESLIARFPRRSSEALYASQIEGQWFDDEPIAGGWEELDLQLHRLTLLEQS